MSRLMGQLFRDSPLLVWPLVSLTIFVVTFAAVILWTYRRRASYIEAVSALPLSDDDDGGEK